MCIAVLCASATAAGASESSALVVFLAPSAQLTGSSESNMVEHELASIPALSTGILSATQGTYTTAQLVLDITQGARVSGSSYKPPNPPFLSLPIGAQAGGTVVTAGSPTNQPASGPDRVGANAVTGSQVVSWPAVLARAHSAPQLLAPGLLATQVPGGGAYIPTAGIDTTDGVVAADQNGHVAAVLGSSSTLLSSVRQLRARHRLVVADLPTGPAGDTDLRHLAASRPPGELLVVVQRVNQLNPTAGQSGHELLWVAFAGIGPGGHTLTSQTTNQSGLVAAIDIAPTILAHLGLPIPADMRGRPVHTDGALHSAALRALKSRLAVIDSRRLPAVAWLIAAWALLLAAARLPFGSGERPRLTSRPGEHPARLTSSFETSGRPARVAWAMRVGALAILWTPVAVLLPAALEPSRAAEFALVVAVCFVLGTLTDRFLPWPRAPIAPAVAAVLALSVDALAGTQLLMRSLLGPNPAFGARFYGIGNELKSGLAVLVFAAVAAALYPAVRSRRGATTMACAGILLAIVEGSARIGAGVGAVILVSSGTAVATMMLLPGTLTDRKSGGPPPRTVVKRVLLVIAAPIAGLVALAALDLATAHGGGHFTGSVLDARSAGDIRDIIVRRYSAAYGELRNHLMPVATALALIASAVAIRGHKRVCAPVDSDPAWLAALAGGLTAGAIGALTEDSGPVLLVVAVFALGCVLSYLWGKPPGSEALTPRNLDTLPATRSRALRR